MVTLVNRAKVATATTGTGTITLGAAESGYQSFSDAGLTGSDTVRYTIEDGDAWEIGTGGINGAVTTMSRTLIESSTGSKLSLSGDAVVYVTAAGQDIVQPSDLATVATSGAYSDLSGLPTLGTAAAADTGDFATAAQGALADSAVQPNDSPSFGSVTVSGTVDGRDVAADGSKLDGIEAGATADQTAGEIKTAYESNANTNAYTDAEKSKLAGIEAGAEVNTVDSVNTQTGAVVLDADDISDAATTNKFTTAAEISKLAGIEAGANVTDTANVTAAGALMDSEVTNLAQVKAFDSADYATAAQGSLADSALQSGDNVSALTNDAGYTTNVGDITGVTAGGGISGGGTSGTVTVSHADTSSQGSVNNSGATVIQDVTVDTYGHVTGLGSKTLTAADVGAITGNQTITLSGDLSGSGTTSINAQIASGVVGATELNVTGNGTTAQFLRSDGDGSFTWATPTDTNTTYSAGTALDLSGTTFNVDLSELSTSTTNGDGDYFVVVDTSNVQRKLTKGNIGISGFSNDAGYTTNVGDITGVTAGTGLSGGGTSGTVTLSHADTSTLSGVYGSTADGTKIDTITVDANGHVTAVTTGATGDIQGVTAGSGISGGGTSGTVTISHADTSSQGSVNNSGSVFIQDITLDTYGHITGITSATASSPITATPTLSGASAPTVFADYVVTISNFGSYTNAIFYYKLLNSTSQVVSSGWTSNNTITFTADTFDAGTHTIYVNAVEPQKSLSSPASKALAASAALSFRYLRVDNVGISPPDANAGIAEFRVFSGLGQTGTDYSPSSITASYFYSGYPPAHAHDEDTVTMWWTLGNGSGSWLQYDLGAVRSIRSFRFNSFQDSNNYQFSVARLLASNTGSFSGEEQTLFDPLSTAGIPILNIG